jgi:Lipocalin-like domain
MSARRFRLARGPTSWDGPDGRMIVIIVGSDRKKPVGPIATQEEAQDLIRSMLAYAGTYTVDSSAKTVTHHVEISWDQSRTGASQVRTYKLDGDRRLTLITQPSNDPATGKKTVRTLVWELMK